MTKEIEKLIDYLGVSVREFEIKIGASNGLIRKAINNETDINSKWMTSIVENFPRVNAEWLLTGKGDMLKAGEIKDEQNREYTAVPASCFTGIPLIPEAAYAGYAKGESQILELECEHYVIPHFRGADGLIYVKGSSMCPKYNSGDIVAFKKLSLDTFFQWNKVYILDTDQGILIKRVQQAERPQYITLVSDNTDYKPFSLPLTAVYSIAIVVGVIRLE